MAWLIQSLPLEKNQIINKLRSLRRNSLAHTSNYAVAAMIEIRLEDGMYAYISGVNVENHEHNRLGIHAEQNAVSAAQTLLGKGVKFSKIWVMGAPAHLDEMSHDALVDIYVQPCGHCRQILLGHAAKDAEIYSITVKGKISEPLQMSDLLPNAFDESHLDCSSEKQEVTTGTKLLKAYDLIKQSATLEKADILNYFKAMTPRVLNESFKTSPIMSCIIKLVSNHYIPGTLVQDIAFLTTDAIFSALGLAVTQFGHEKLEFTEVHLYADSLDNAWLTGSECGLIGKFTKKDIPIHFYTPEGKRSYKLSEMNGILNE